MHELSAKTLQTLDLGPGDLVQATFGRYKDVCSVLEWLASFQIEYHEFPLLVSRLLRC